MAQVNQGTSQENTTKTRLKNISILVVTVCQDEIETFLYKRDVKYFNSLSLYFITNLDYNSLEPIRKIITSLLAII